MQVDFPIERRQTHWRDESIRRFFGAFCDRTALTLHCLSLPFFSHVTWPLNSEPSGGEFFLNLRVGCRVVQQPLFVTSRRCRGRRCKNRYVLDSSQASALSLLGTNKSRLSCPTCRQRLTCLQLPAKFNLVEAIIVGTFNTDFCSRNRVAPSSETSRAVNWTSCVILQALHILKQSQMRLHVSVVFFIYAFFSRVRGATRHMPPPSG